VSNHVVSPLDPATDAALVALIRGIAMDAPLHAKSGHQGTAMSLAPVAHVLFSRIMRHDPADPAWPDRDRFVLSNGHASILQYALLFLAGYGLELDDLRAFRQWGSLTPGHPERGHTPGIEVTTGPLGQGFANAVGMAMAEERLRACFGPDVCDHHVYVLAGDGCLQEGVSHEAASLAGHQRLGHLVVVYDDNRITIDGSTDLSSSDDAAQRFRAYGWHVLELGEAGEDLDALERALAEARDHTSAPSLVVLRTHIAYPSPDLTDDHRAHGNPFTPEQVSRTKAVMGIPDEPFWAPDHLVSAARAHAAARGAAARGAWTGRIDALDADARRRWQAAWSAGPVADLGELLPSYEQGASVATRVAVQEVISASLDAVPAMVAGAADLTGNTGAKLAGASAFSPSDRTGRQIHFGIREHGMAAAAVGMALHGGVLPVVGTFFVFADYLRPALRLAALSAARVVFVFSHDSVGVGEDGPTHQPVEQLASLRCIPGLQVIRPADANETVAAWRAVFDHDGPTALVLSRQNLPVVTDGAAVATGGDVVRAATGAAGDGAALPSIVLVGTGSEVAVCLEAAELLAADGVTAQVVSLPSWDRFDRRADGRAATCFPAGVPVVSVEAASTFGWSRFASAAVGIDRFGASAPGGEVLDRLGINPTRVAEVARTLLQEGTR
jgi:transketolase